MKINDEIYKFNLKKQLKNIYSSLIEDCFKYKNRLDPKFGNSYLLETKYNNYLYDIFIKYCNKVLNKFTLKDNDFKCWCYYSDITFTKGNWHNHKKSSTINSVVYLNLPKKEKGIDFKINNKIFNFIPKQFDFIIFPNYLEHYPYPSNTDEPRISLNLELRCFEDSRKIFKLND
jgi:hypothetical protein